MNKFKKGDRVVYTGSGDARITEAMNCYCRPYFIIDETRYNSHGCPLVFMEEPLRRWTGSGAEYNYPNAWVDHCFELYKEPVALPEELFTL